LHEIGNGLTACHLSKTDIERMNNDELPVV
jgi:hypothetical protein